MWHTLIHIYGPVSIHSYGLAIAIGLLITIYLIKKDRRFKKLQLTDDKFTKILIASIVTGIIGGRALFLIASPQYMTSFADLFTFWLGGYSILGCVIALAITLPICTALLHVPILGFLDLVSIYTPFLQGVSRIGCLLAGCCYGMPTTVPWGIIYTDPESEAPLNICMHPTQIYSTMALLLIFSFMYFYARKKFEIPGQLVGLYFMLIGLERFTVDFWRGDRPLVAADVVTLSLYQYIAAGMFIGGALFYCGVTVYKRRS